MFHFSKGYHCIVYVFDHFQKSFQQVHSLKNWFIFRLWRCGIALPRSCWAPTSTHAPSTFGQSALSSRKWQAKNRFSRWFHKKSNPLSKMILRSRLLCRDIRLNLTFDLAPFFQSRNLRSILIKKKKNLKCLPVNITSIKKVVEHNNFDSREILRLTSCFAYSASFEHPLKRSGRASPSCQTSR
jgi:hypothetical protein